MGTISRRLASGLGWYVDDVVCTSGPRDRPFEEQHDGVCIAAVTEGTFQYRSTQGSAVLAPGAVLLGNDRHCFECGHEHGTGDRCLSFHFAPEFLEAMMAATPGVRQTVFTVSHLPPLPALIPIVSVAVASRDDGDGAELEEQALCLASVVSDALAGAKHSPRTPSAQDEKRVTLALRWIEAEAHEKLTLAGLARRTAMSPYYFLRMFRATIGMTPYQYILRTRLHRAAVRLRQSNDNISTIALDAGFNDLSTFNRRFRRVMGASPSAYRTHGGSWLVKTRGRRQDAFEQDLRKFRLS